MSLLAWTPDQTNNHFQMIFFRNLVWVEFDTRNLSLCYTILISDRLAIKWCRKKPFDSCLFFLNLRSNKHQFWIMLWKCCFGWVCHHILSLCYTILISDCHAIEWCREKNLWQLLIFFARNTGYRRVVLNFLVSTVYRLDSKTSAPLYLWYSKASRYVTSRCADLADIRFWIGSKKIQDMNR